MAHVEVDKAHNLGLTEAMARLGRVQEQLQDKYAFLIVWNGHQAEVKGLGANGRVRVDDVRLKLSINLSLLLRPFASKIKRLVETTIDDALAGKLGEL